MPPLKHHSTYPTFHITLPLLISGPFLADRLILAV